MDRQTFTTSTGVTLSYLTAGDSGAPIILLHGITAGAGTYGDIGDRLAENHRVFALDFRGHGESDRVGPSYTADLYVADTIEFIRHVAGDEPAVLAGHSLGSMVAAAIAGANAVPLRGVLLEDPPLFSGQPDGPGRQMLVIAFTMLQNAMKSHHEAEQSIDDLAAMIADWPVFGDPGKTNKDIVTADAISLQATLMHQCDWHVLDVITGDEDIGFAQAETYLPNITCPVHVLAGNAERGAVITADDFEKGKAMIPGATGALVSEVGHLIHEHAPARYWDELSAFLDRVA